MRPLTSLFDAPAAATLPRLPVARWIEVARERRALARLTDRDLRDIGLDPERARLEADRPFWDLPAGR
jgi:uncharacterized protein YjiS (DUF1127 family)